MLLTKKRKAKFFKAIGKTWVSYLPFILGMETGNICNLKCPLCPTGADDKAMQKGFLSLGLFKKIIDEAGPNLSGLNLYSWGEPLLNKNLIAMVSYAKKINPKLRITISTNFNIKDKSVLSELIASGIDEIIVSCDGASRDTYLKYRVGGDFDLVIENMKFLIKEKNRLAKDCRIVWNFLVFKHNETELEQARQMAKEIGADFRIGLMRTTMKDEILKEHSQSIEKDLSWIPDNPAYSAYDKGKLATKKILKSCRKPWQEMSINWDGKVFPCCAVYGDSFALADVKNSSIRQAWNSKNYQQARKEILGKKTDKISICGICKSHGFMHM